MKTYSIGRDLNCDIVINDTTDVISRRHALLNVTPSGKMTIIDQSSNGTYVNGIRISQNVPVPVTRRDVVSLAHVAKLDWNQVPRSNQATKYIIGGIIGAALITGTVFGVRAILNNESGNAVEDVIVASEMNDSTLTKQNEAARADSIKEVAPRDSIVAATEKERRDSVQTGNRAKHKSDAKHKEGGKEKGKDDANVQDDGKDKKEKPVSRAII